MRQLTQTLKDGTMEIIEAPIPALQDGSILVRNHYSVISAGTEGKTVKDARLSYIGKAKSRKKEVKQVLDSVRTEGLVPTYQLVMNKLNSLSALGYSCAGEVIDVGNDVKNIKIGDFVACGGATAVHAEIVSVPKNLCVKVPDNVELKYAAYATIASIAMQGIRQAETELGENIVVIGLGLIGQITLKLLDAAGVNVIGIDIDPKQVEIAKKSGFSNSFVRNREGIEEIIKTLTSGYGADSIIITASTSSNDPVEFAGKIARKKASVIIVGAVPTGFSRAEYYKKELELKMSSSYGPGRYDSNYEEKGIDYPIGYVRWTENRNMEAFIKLLSSKKINFESIITHEFPFSDSRKAYDLILQRSEPFLGINLKYKTDKPINKTVFFDRKVSSVSKVKVGFIGAGSFAQNYLLPNVKKIADMVGVATASSNNAVNIAKKYEFNFSTCDYKEVLNNKELNTVFIATRHNQHGEQVLESIKANKNVFVEKPLCLCEEELEDIKNEYNKNDVRVMVGFNRRFAPLIKELKTKLDSEIPKAINYRINAGTIPKEHWVQDVKIGGGRLIGEVCHFIDLATFIADSKVKRVSAETVLSSPQLDDTLVINLAFHNGSIASISYFSNGNKNVKKEFLEVFYANIIFTINDFSEMTITSDTKSKRIKLKKQDKGHKAELNQFVSSIKDGSETPIKFDESYHSTLVTFKVLESLRKCQTIEII